MASSSGTNLSPRLASRPSQVLPSLYSSRDLACPALIVLGGRPSPRRPVTPQKLAVPPAALPQQVRFTQVVRIAGAAPKEITVVVDARYVPGTHGQLGVSVPAGPTCADPVPFLFEEPARLVP